MQPALDCGRKLPAPGSRYLAWAHSRAEAVKGRRWSAAIRDSVLKEQLAAREARSVGVVAAEARPISPDAGVALLEALGRALGVDPGKLRTGDRLETLFADRGPEAAADPRCSALLSALGGLVTPEALDRLGKTISPEPRTDAEWLNVILGLRVGEWVRTWAPAVAESFASRGGASKRERAFPRE